MTITRHSDMAGRKQLQGLASAAPATAAHGGSPCIENRVRPLTERPVLTIRARVSESQVSSFIGQALGDVRAYIHEHHADPAGPPFANCRPAGGQGFVDVEAGWPVERETPGAGRIHSGSLPCTTARNLERRHADDIDL